MKKILKEEEVNRFKKDGAIFLKGKFDINWIKKLQTGIEKDIKNPSPRFKSHTIKKKCSCLPRRLLDMGFSIRI